MTTAGLSIPVSTDEDTTLRIPEFQLCEWWGETGGLLYLYDFQFTEKT